MTQKEFRERSEELLTMAAKLSAQMNEQSEFNKKLDKRTEDLVNKMHKMELFVYGDPVTGTKGVVQESRDVREELDSIKSLLKFTKGKAAGILIAVSGLSAIAYKIYTFFQK